MGNGEARRISARVMQVAVSPQDETPQQTTSQKILAAVVEVTKIPLKELAGSGRSKRLARARHLAMYLLREMTDMTLGEVGATLGGRDHTTVIYGVERAKRPEVRDLLDLCRRKSLGITTAAPSRSWRFEIVDPGTDRAPRIRVVYSRPDGTDWEISLPMVPR